MPVKRVYKYDLPLRDVVRVTMPSDAIVLHVGVQHDEPFVWALVDPDPDVACVDRVFRIAGTGHDVDWPECVSYVGTFQMSGGALVFHVFDLGERDRLFLRQSPREGAKLMGEGTLEQQVASLKEQLRMCRADLALRTRERDQSWRNIDELKTLIQPIHGKLFTELDMLLAYAQAAASRLREAMKGGLAPEDPYVVLVAAETRLIAARAGIVNVWVRQGGPRG